MTAATRQRRYRQRQRFGRGIVPVEVDLIALSEALIESGYLRLDEATDFNAVCRATSRFLEERAFSVTRYSPASPRVSLRLAP